MILPYHVDVPMSRLPIANWVVIGVTTLVSLAHLAADSTWLDVYPALVMADLSSDAAKDLQRRLQDPPVPPLALQRSPFSWWGLVTYPFVHADPFHLLGNMVFLFCFGNAINAKVGHGPFLAFYFLLGLAGGLAWLVLGQAKALAGASGAIMGLTGIFLVLYPRNEVRVLYGSTLSRSFEISSCWLVLLCMGADLFGTLLGDGGGVGYACHLGGELLGVMIGLALVRWRLVESTAYEENLLEVLGWQEHPRHRRRR